MSTKTDVAKMLKSMPKSATLADIQYHLYVLERLQKSHASVKRHGTIPHAVVAQRLKKWLIK